MTCLLYTSPDCGLPVIFTDNQKPYKQRKVRILNGAHTSFVPAAFLCGYDSVSYTHLQTWWV